MGTQLPSTKRGKAPPPIFGPCLLSPNSWIDQDEICDAGRPQPWPHCVRRGPISISPKGHSPQFSAHICCGQMAGWIKMPTVRMEVGLGSGDLVLDEDQAPFPKKGAEPPNFRPMSIVAKRLDGSRWYLAWRWASVQVTLCEMGTQLPHKKWGPEPPQFSAHVYCGHGRPSHLLLSSC